MAQEPTIGTVLLSTDSRISGLLNQQSILQSTHDVPIRCTFGESGAIVTICPLYVQGAFADEMVERGVNFTLLNQTGTDPALQPDMGYVTFGVPIDIHVNWAVLKIDNEEDEVMIADSLNFETLEDLGADPDTTKEAGSVSSRHSIIWQGYETLVPGQTVKVNRSQLAETFDGLISPGDSFILAIECITNLVDINMTPIGIKGCVVGKFSYAVKLPKTRGDSPTGLNNDGSTSGSTNLGKSPC